MVTKVTLEESGCYILVSELRLRKPELFEFCFVLLLVEAVFKTFRGEVWVDLV